METCKVCGRQLDTAYRNRAGMKPRSCAEALRNVRNLFRADKRLKRSLQYWYSRAVMCFPDDRKGA